MIPAIVAARMMRCQQPRGWGVTTQNVNHIRLVRNSIRGWLQHRIVSQRCTIGQVPGQQIRCLALACASRGELLAVDKVTLFIQLVAVRAAATDGDTGAEPLIVFGVPCVTFIALPVGFAVSIVVDVTLLAGEHETCAVG